MNFKRYRSIFLLFILFGLFSCENDPREKKDSTSTSIRVIRFEKLLMEMDTSNIKEAFSQLSEEYPSFTEIYFSKVLALNASEEKNDSFFTQLKAFVSDERIREVYHLINEQYASFDEEYKALSLAFESARNFFPEMETPVIYTYLSEFSLQGFLFEDGDKEGLAIGLDLFLGEDFNYSLLEQGNNTFANYLTRSFNKEHLVKKVIESWLEDKMGNPSGNRLIDHMLFNGKNLYLLNKITESKDSVLLEYTADQIKWIQNNEKELWSFYFEKNWFYTTEQYVIKRLVFPSPNSTAIGMPQSAPGQTGNYLGWKIVESYMKRNPETSLGQLLSMDSQRLLELSKFKPKR